MKKLILVVLSALLVACSSGVNMNELAGKMPTNSVMIKVPSAGNVVSDGMLLGVIKVSGSNAAKGIIEALAVDNLNIGVFGESEAINKATLLYALNNAPKIGANTAIYFVGSASNKADLEKVTAAKGIKLHYFVKEA